MEMVQTVWAAVNGSDGPDNCTCEDVSVEVDELLERSVLGGLKQTKIKTTVHFGRPTRNRD